MNINDYPLLEKLVTIFRQLTALMRWPFTQVLLYNVCMCILFMFVAYYTFVWKFF